MVASCCHLHCQMLPEVMPAAATELLHLAAVLAASGIWQFRQQLAAYLPAIEFWQHVAADRLAASMAANIAAPDNTPFSNWQEFWQQLPTNPGMLPCAVRCCLVLPESSHLAAIFAAPCSSSGSTW
jgi:hypothetical protein